MRKVLITLAILLVVGLQAARADVNPNAAPADEYFGPYQQSVLEIRNRLNDYDRLDGGTMLDPSVGAYLDHLQLAIRDWQHKYPRDPWMAPILGHLMREYWRCGQASSATGMAALAFMRANYPDSPVTQRTVAMIYGSNRGLDEIARDESVPQPPPAPVSVAPIRTDVPAEASLPSYAQIPAYGSASYGATNGYATIPSYATPTQDGPVTDIAASDQAAPQASSPVSDVAPSAPDASNADVSNPDDDAPTPPPAR
ncbi:MAG TPA: hypothetical protein VHT92_07895 [Candidatus Cybelea sp.]|jgi:hypothetical protein|nr:hypothetical protein [Candidatus Cybelea sp.]